MSQYKTSIDCVAKDCPNNWYNCELGFFSFPKDHNRAEMWLIACGREDLRDKMDKLSSYRLCAIHFEEKMYLNDLKNHLLHNAVPTIFPALTCSSSSSTTLLGSQFIHQKPVTGVIPCKNMEEISLKEEPKLEFDHNSPSFLFIKEESLDIKCENLNEIQSEFESTNYSEKLDTHFKTEIDDNICVKQELTSEMTIKDEISNEENDIFTQTNKDFGYKRRRLLTIKKKTWLKQMFKEIGRGLLTFNRKTAISGGSTSSNKYQSVTSSRNECAFCYFCMKLFLSVPQFRNHCIRCHLVVKMSTPRNNLKYDNCESKPKKKSLQGDANWERFQMKSYLKLHTELKPFKCDICSKEFSQKGHLNVHMTLHSGVKSFKCDICSKEFTQKSHCNTHMKFHPDVNVFTDSSTLSTHLISHTGVKPFKCIICLKEFTRKSTLNRHMQVHTGIQIFKCHICSEEFIWIEIFKEHMKSHTCVRPKCDICSKEFTLEDSLKVHMKLHTGLKPFKCDVCSKEFTQKSHYNTHMKFHPDIYVLTYSSTLSTH